MATSETILLMVSASQLQSFILVTRAWKNAFSVMDSSIPAGIDCWMENFTWSGANPFSQNLTHSTLRFSLSRSSGVALDMSSVLDSTSMTPSKSVVI